jgi:hypothetical protein
MNCGRGWVCGRTAPTLLGTLLDRLAHRIAAARRVFLAGSARISPARKVKGADVQRVQNLSLLQSTLLRQCRLAATGERALPNEDGENYTGSR